MKKLNLPLHQIDLLSKNGRPPINDNPSDAFCGEYYSISVNGVLNKNALRFIDELMKSADPEISDYGQRLQHNFTNQLTHDGLPRHKKPGFWKRVVSFWR